ncbi:MAG: hypothetical protein SWO11_13925, partial [Thermodesulfobacteriota bacterium]|nr:hypothetical protein [Thermodesulfobacteriota bacterium]
ASKKRQSNFNACIALKFDCRFLLADSFLFHSAKMIQKYKVAVYLPKNDPSKKKLLFISLIDIPKIS